MYKIELLKGNWYNRSYGEKQFNAIRNLEHLKDVEFIGDNVIIIPRNNILIGTLPVNHVVIDDQYIQRRQCRVEILPWHIFLKDLGARDHTLILRRGKTHFANNTGIEIYAGDVLKLRETQLRLLEARVS